MAGWLFRRVTTQVLHEHRPQPDDARVSLEHVEQFRQFVQRPGPQKFSNPGETLFIGQQTSLRPLGADHGAEFMKGEEFAVEAGAFLAKANREPQKLPFNT